MLCAALDCYASDCWRDESDPAPANADRWLQCRTSDRRDGSALHYKTSWPQGRWKRPQPPRMTLQPPSCRGKSSPRASACLYAAQRDSTQLHGLNIDLKVRKVNHHDHRCCGHAPRHTSSSVQIFNPREVRVFNISASSPPHLRLIISASSPSHLSLRKGLCDPMPYPAKTPTRRVLWEGPSLKGERC